MSKQAGHYQDRITVRRICETRYSFPLESALRSPMTARVLRVFLLRQKDIREPMLFEHGRTRMYWLVLARPADRGEGLRRFRTRPPDKW
jgi:hypothetical protein